MKRLLMVVSALTFSVALFVPLGSANVIARESVAQDAAKEEADAYAAWYTAYKAQDAAKTLELGKAFVEKFPNSKYADFVKKDFIREYGILFGKAVQEKNMAEVVRIGNEVLASNPENLDYIWAVLVQIRTNGLSATPPNYAHAREGADLTQRAIRLFEAGKTLTGVKPETFKLDVTLGFLHQTLAMIYDHDKNIDNALAAYEKAGALDSTNAAYFFHCGRIHNDKYAAAAQKYEPAQKKSEDLEKKVQAIPEADRTAAEPKPDVKNLLAESKAAQDAEKAALAEVNSQADAVIKCWARFLGLTAEKNTWGDTRAKILQAFTELYKFRHNNSADGMDKLIDQNKAAAPANSGSTSAAAAKP